MSLRFKPAISDSKHDIKLGRKDWAYHVITSSQTPTILSKGTYVENNVLIKADSMCTGNIKIHCRVTHQCAFKERFI